LVSKNPVYIIVHISFLLDLLFFLCAMSGAVLFWHAFNICTLSKQYILFFAYDSTY